MSLTKMRSELVDFCCQGDFDSVKDLYERGGHLINTLELHRGNNSIFGIACSSGNLDLVSWLYSKSPSVNMDEFTSACEFNRLEVAKKLLEWNPNLDLAQNDYDCFRFTCFAGSLSVAKWLYETHPEVDILNDNDGFSFFHNLCMDGQKEVAEWILSLKPEIDIFGYDDEFIFKTAYEPFEENLETIKWLYGLRGGFDIHAEDDRLLKYAKESGFTELEDWIKTIG